MLSKSDRPYSVLHFEDLLKGKGERGPRFLGETESLAELMASDDATVKDLGLSHDQIAEPLIKALEAAKPGVFDGVFEFNGKQFEFEVLCAAGSIVSPFDKKRRVSRDMIINHPNSNDYIRISYLSPEFIRDFHFYQGHESDYRLDPRKLAEFFGLL